MDDRLTFINKLVQDGVEGTQSLYSVIPFFTRNRLNALIDNYPWPVILDGCQRGDPASFQEAQKIYTQFLCDMDVYIERSKTAFPQNFNSALMMLDKNQIKERFGDDGVKFAQEMLACLEKEKELIFLHYKENVEEPQKLICSPMSPEDTLLMEIEQSLQMALNYLDNVRRNPEALIDLESVTAQEIHMDLPAECQTSLPSTFEQSSEMVKAILCGLESQEQSEEWLRNQYQEAMLAFEQLHQQCSNFVEQLSDKVTRWKNAEAKSSVLVGPQKDLAELCMRVQRFCKVLNDVLSLFVPGGEMSYIREWDRSHQSGSVLVVSRVTELEASFKQVMKRLFEFNIIVVTQPKGVISIENKGTKKEPNYCTKKTQAFETSIRILGAECFTNAVITAAPEIELVAEKDLAQNASQSQSKPNLSCKSDPERITDGSKFQVNYKDVEVKNFSRVELNNVYKQFFRLRYKVSVKVFDSEFYLQTLSLPFMFNTGSNQLLEHNGARMWYFASTVDLYNGDFQCKDSLPLEEVIDILDKRVKHIHSEARSLRDDEKAFFRQRLQANSEGKVTMQSFIKDKLKDPRSGEELNFSFYIWFHAVMYSIESTSLLHAWLDGVIFGFCSERAANEKLMNESIPEGTILLRPSISEIVNTSSKGAAAAITMEVKMRAESNISHDSQKRTYQVLLVPLILSSIQENTLYRTVSGMSYNGKKIAKFLYGTNKRIDSLKKYGEKQREHFFPNYKLVMTKLQNISLRTQENEGAANESADESGPEPSSRKRRYTRASSSASSQNPPSVQPFWGGPSPMGDSSGNSFNAPLESVQQSPSSMMQDVDTSTQAVSSDNSQQSPGQKFRASEDLITSGKISSQSQQAQSVPQPNFMKMGNIEIDTSNLHQQLSVPEVASEVVVNSFHSASNSPDSMLCGQVDNAKYGRNITGYDFASTGTSLDTNPSLVSHNSASSFQSSSNLPTVLSEASEPSKGQKRRTRNSGKRSSLSSTAPAPHMSRNNIETSEIQPSLPMNNNLHEALLLHIQNYGNNSTSFYQPSNTQEEIATTVSGLQGIPQGFSDMQLMDGEMMGFQQTSPADSGISDNQSPSPSDSMKMHNFTLN